MFVIIQKGGGKKGKMFLKEQLGQNIQILRKKKKLTQEKFAELIGIDSKNVSKIEIGKNYPAAETLSLIIKALDIEPYELFIFDNNINYEKMKNEIITSLEDKNILVHLYKYLKTIE